jgi:hypothetical protein
MGVTIHYTLAQTVQHAKSTVDEIERIARLIKNHQAEALGIQFLVNRKSDTGIRIDIDGCETLDISFKTMEQVQADYRYFNPLADYMQFEKSHTGPHYDRWPEQRLLWVSNFCKTQYAKNAIAHKWVADLIKVAASRAKLASVYDEGDYYHNGQLEDAKEAIEKLGESINKIGEMFSKKGYSMIKGGETVIKSTKRRKK